MKKVLLATTMLVAGASIAAAEVTLSGDARMGITNGFAAPGAFDPTTFTSRARVTFTMAGESDSGLSFGASFRADNAAGAAAGTAGSVFISGAFGKISMGDVDGAANAAVGHVDGVGLTGLGDLNESLYIGSGGLSFATVLDLLNAPAIPAGFTASPLTSDSSVLYEYSAGSFTFYASATAPGYRGTITDGTVLPAAVTTNFDGDSYSIGAAYSFDAYKLSLGYESVDVSFLGNPAGAVVGTIEADHIIAGADATFGAFTAKVRYGQADVDANNVNIADLEQFALSGTYKMDAVSVTGFFSTRDVATPAGVALSSRDALGIGASYDLGGGASVKGGVVQRTTQAGAAPKQKDTSFDLGVAFTF